MEVTIQDEIDFIQKEYGNVDLTVMESHEKGTVSLVVSGELGTSYIRRSLARSTIGTVFVLEEEITC